MSGVRRDGQVGDCSAILRRLWRDRLERSIKGKNILHCQHRNATIVFLPIMKSALVSALLFSGALSTVVPKADKKIDYTGFKLVRILSTDATQKAQINSLAAHILNPGRTENFDVVVSPDKVDALTALVTDSVVINEDVGAALAEEGEFEVYAGMIVLPASVLCKS